MTAPKSPANLWETPYQLRTDAAGAARLAALTRREPAIAEIATAIVGRFQPSERTFFCLARVRADGRPLLIKLGATRHERLWLAAIHAASADVVPRIYAHGDTLAGLDIGWLVLERISNRPDPGNPLHCDAHARVVARYQRAAQDMPHDTQALDGDVLARWTCNAAATDCPGPTRALHKRVERDWLWASSLCGVTPCHGDAHFDNALLTDRGTVLLIDAQPRTTIWAWDAAYAQMRHAQPETPELVALLARARTQLGLTTPAAAELETLNTIVLAWAAALWWQWAPWRRPDAWWQRELEKRISAVEHLAHRT